MLQLDSMGPRVARRTPEGFDDRPYERFSLRALPPTIGAEVTGVHLADVDDELQAEIHRALPEWKVLFFRDQDISQDQPRDSAARWGELESHPLPKPAPPAQPPTPPPRPPP